MSKQKQIQKIESEQLIDELSKMPPMVIATAYLHAINYTLYGVDVTEKWLTATQQAYALEKAYNEGYHDALVKPQRPPGKWLDKKITIKGAHGMAYGRYACSVCNKKFPNKSNYCPDCGAEMESEE